MSNCEDCARYESITETNLFGTCSSYALTLPTIPATGCPGFISKTVHKEKELFRFALIRRLTELDRSQTWLAKQLDIDPANVSLYVSSKRVPRANTFLRICDILEINPKEVRFE